MKSRILIIDDDTFIGDLLKDTIETMGYQVVVEETLKQGLAILDSEVFDLVLLDVLLPDGNGLESIDLITGVRSPPDVIIITAEPKAAAACMALEKNAWDYIAKPFSQDEVKLSVERALEHRTLRAVASGQHFHQDFSGIIGSSSLIEACKQKAMQSALTDANVLITGETGTGKELFAANIHRNSRLKANHFVVVDCAALPEQLTESVLFGHIKGAFTGAEANREGLLKRADGGTLFLDEVGEMSLSVQKKFLRALQERIFNPVGSTESIQSRFRLISATNRDLGRMVEQKMFRSDLYYRLNTVHIDLPALRECKTDIEELARYYTKRLCKHYGMKTKKLAPQFVETLKSYDWPGNTRELINCLESAIVRCSDSEILYPNFLPTGIRVSYLESRFETGNAKPLVQNGDLSGRITVSIELPHDLLHPIKPLKKVKRYATDELERHYLSELIRRTGGDINDAIRLSGISKSHLYALMKKHNLFMG